MGLFCNFWSFGLPQAWSLTYKAFLVSKTFEQARSRHPSPEDRFLRLPIIASCAVSGLPASKIGKAPLGRDQPISQVIRTPP